LLASVLEIRESLSENFCRVASQFLYRLSRAAPPQPTGLFGDLLKTPFNQALNHSTLHLGQWRVWVAHMFQITLEILRSDHASSRYVLSGKQWNSRGAVMLMGDDDR
jgi:hypothetical protein